MERNIWFNFASDKGRKPGISPTVNKLARFNLVVPLFKARKIFFPEEMMKSQIMGEFVSELKLATVKGLKSKHDDCLDTISMLMYLTAWKPTEDIGMSVDESGRWQYDDEEDHHSGPMSSYIV